MNNTKRETKIFPENRVLWAEQWKCVMAMAVNIFSDKVTVNSFSLLVRSLVQRTVYELRTRNTQEELHTKPNHFFQFVLSQLLSQSNAHTHKSIDSYLDAHETLNDATQNHRYLKTSQELTHSKRTNNKQTTTTTMSQFKLAIVGGGGVGKSALTVRYVNDKFNDVCYLMMMMMIMMMSCTWRMNE